MDISSGLFKWFINEELDFNMHRSPWSSSAIFEDMQNLYELFFSILRDYISDGFTSI